MVRVIPVLDLKAGLAVHAVRGQRDAYAPVKSVLARSADPLDLGRALVTRLGAKDCYVADLDAIARVGDHRQAIHDLAGLGLRVWLDAGIASVDDAERARSLGAARIIVGTETLTDPRDLAAMVTALGGESTSSCILSLDLHEGRLRGGSPAVARLGPGDLAAIAWEAGIRTFIVLDLARVGSEEGPRLDAARALRRAFGDAELVIGGGVRDGADLAALDTEGFQGALVATALHRGVISALDPGRSA
jgi:phosphoribosylformimino-5-aminoimidazole carboxamide ribotide isomerase